MSLLNWVSTPEAILIVTDTLATRDNLPLCFCAKVTAAPHMKMAFGGTGVAQMSQLFAFHSMNDGLATNIDQVAAGAPSVLLKIWDRLGLPPIDPDAEQRLTTIYTFGWSEERQSFVVAANRSINMFQTEWLPHSIGLKPPPQGVTPLTELKIACVDDLAEMARQQKAEDDELPPELGVGIGGELIGFQLVRGESGEVIIGSSSLGRFEDFERHRLTMLLRAAGG